MGSSIRLLVAGEFKWHCGSSHVIREYVRHGPSAGIEVKLSARFGSRDSAMWRALPYCDDLSWATHLLVVLEGNAFLTAADLAIIEHAFPRSRRAVIDADAHWCPYVDIRTDNNGWPCGTTAWREQISAISDLVLQPRSGTPCNGATVFPYHGMPPVSAPTTQVATDAHVHYVGCNWFRSPALVEVFGAARAALGQGAILRVSGRFWDGKTRPGFEAATRADTDALDALQVQRCPPVAFGAVVSTMSASLLTPVLVRPLLSKLRMLTPRMFETIAAATIPLYRAEDRYIGAIWGDSGMFCLGSNPEARIREIVSAVTEFRSATADLRAEMYQRYSYPAILRQLRQLLS